MQRTLECVAAFAIGLPIGFIAITVGFVLATYLMMAMIN